MAYSRIRFEIQNSATMTLVHMQASIDAVNEKFGGKVVTLASTKINSEWAMRRDHLSPCPTTNWDDLPKVT